MELREVCFAYAPEGELILDRVSLRLPKTGLISILGPSGCGKTTLLHLLAGLLEPTSGSVISDGENRPALVLQEAAQIGGMTVEDNAALRAILSGEPEASARSRASKWLAEVGLLDLKDKRAGELSGGERQRLSLCQAACSDAEIILADEPTGALDSANAQRVMEILSRLSNERLVIVVTHSESLAWNWSTQIFRMRDGRLFQAEAKQSLVCLTPKRHRESSDEKRGRGVSFRTRIKLAWGILLGRRARMILSSLATGFAFACLAVAMAIGLASKDFSQGIYNSFFAPGTALISERVDVAQGQGMTLARQSELTEETKEDLKRDTGADFYWNLSYFIPSSGSIQLAREVVDYGIEPYLEPGAVSLGRLPRHAREAVANSALATALNIPAEALIGKTFGSFVDREVPIYLSIGTETLRYTQDWHFTIVGVAQENEAFNSPVIYYAYQLCWSELRQTSLLGEMEMTVGDLLDEDDYAGTDVRGYATVVFAEDDLSLREWVKGAGDSISCNSRAINSYQAGQDISTAIAKLALIFLGCAAVIALFLEYYSASSICLETVRECALIRLCSRARHSFFKAVSGVSFIFSTAAILGFGLSFSILSILVPNLLKTLGLPSGMFIISPLALLLSLLAMTLLSQIFCSLPFHRMSHERLQASLRSER